MAFDVVDFYFRLHFFPCRRRCCYLKLRRLFFVVVATVTAVTASVAATATAAAAFVTAPLCAGICLSRKFFFCYCYKGANCKKKFNNNEPILWG